MNFHNNQVKKAFAAISKAYTDIQDERTRRLINCLNYDLYFGPIDEEPDGDGFKYPGFEAACKEIEPFVDSLPSDLWWDTQAEELLTAEPVGYTDEDTGEYVEPYYEDYMHLDARDIKQAALGKELANTI